MNLDLMNPREVLRLGPQEYSGPNPWGKKGLFEPLLGTEVSKVRCYTYGIRAKATCPGAVYGRGTVCQECYACGGNYRYPSVKKAHLRRLMAFATDPARWVDIVVQQLREREFDYCRLHDSGDFYAPEYVLAWEQVARQVPGVQFFSPTRTWRLDEFLPALRRLNRLPNFTVRPSALFLGQSAPRVRGLAGGLGVVPNAQESTCPASKKSGGTCTGSRCRRCWTKPEQQINFRLHK